MTNKEKNENFIKEFYKKYPNYKILYFEKLTSIIVFEDEKGILRKHDKPYRLLLHEISLDTIVDIKEYVQNKISKIFPDLKLIQYNGSKAKVVVKDKNGFLFNPSCFDLLAGHPVSIQTCLNKYDFFVFKANLKHNNFYNYSFFEYTNGKKYINIICPFHGVFKQTIEAHLHGNGCSSCNSGGFSKESWTKRCKKEKAIFYILKFYNKEEEFLKIGITNKSVIERYKYLKQYNYEILEIIENTPSVIYDLEKHILKTFKLNKYSPNICFQGKTECFDIKIKQNIYEQIKNKLSEN